LRSSDPLKGFHTAKTQLGHSYSLRSGSFLLAAADRASTDILVAARKQSPWDCRDVARMLYGIDILG